MVCEMLGLPCPFCVDGTICTIGYECIMMREEDDEENEEEDEFYD